MPSQQHALVGMPVASLRQIAILKTNNLSSQTAVFHRHTAIRICVIFNTNAGSSAAQERFSRFRKKWENRATFWETSEQRGAYELAQRAVDEEFSIIAAAGGDGTVHQVANGFLDADGRSKTVIAVLPFGSANDYAYSLSKQFGLATLDDDQSHKVDVGVATDLVLNKHKYFLESLGLGLSGRVADEARLLTHHRGRMRYVTAAWRVARRGLTAKQMWLSCDGTAMKEKTTTLLSLMLGRREGSLILGPNALLDDGLFDYVHAAKLTLWDVCCILPRLAWCGPPANHKQITQGRCSSMTIESDRANGGSPRWGGILWSPWTYQDLQDPCANVAR